MVDFSHCLPQLFEYIFNGSQHIGQVSSFLFESKFDLGGQYKMATLPLVPDLQMCIFLVY